ncbi:hypothetical protein AVEN_21542-1 [Araneus ventricosus]|uniref:Uncharacterized protein n=1 Tax=Araneus ventricosus TaxID=182803 RepID=A0A4Y2EKJ3_ARAVE|nr:hypothetical protein AVEN_21542-1 [Araneus ventricosus]
MTHCLTHLSGVKSSKGVSESVAELYLGAVIGNQLVATGGYHQWGYMGTLKRELSLSLLLPFSGCLHPVAPEVDVSFFASRFPRAYPNGYNRRDITF